MTGMAEPQDDDEDEEEEEVPMLRATKRHTTINSYKKRMSAAPMLFSSLASADGGEESGISQATDARLRRQKSFAALFAPGLQEVPEEEQFGSAEASVTLHSRGSTRGSTAGSATRGSTAGSATRGSTAGSATRGSTAGSGPRCSTRGSIMPGPQPGVSATYTGAFLDFYARSQSTTNVCKKTGMDLVERVLKVKLSGRRNFVVDESGTFHFTAEMIDRDALLFDIMQDLTLFWKAHGSSPWAPFGQEAMQARVWEIIKQRRFERALQAEVERWVAAHTRGQQSLRENEETLHERQARVRGFWDEYQTSFRRLEAPLGKHRGDTGSSRAASPHGLGRRSKTPSSLWHSKTSSSPSAASTGRLPQATLQALHRSKSVGVFHATLGRGPMETIYPRLIPVKDALPEIFRDTKASPWIPPKADPSPGKPRVLQVDRSTAPTRNAALPPITDRDSKTKDHLSKRYQRDHHAKGPVARAVKQPPSGGSTSPARRYVLECESNGIMPTPMPFITGHSLNFHLWDKVLVDNDLLAAAVTLPSMALIEEVDLEGNRVLTDKALVPFLRKLSGHSAIQSLGRLSLRYCVQAGSGALENVISLLGDSLGDTGASHLRELDLSGIAISTRIQQRLCEAIMRHPHLKSVHLADVGLGASSCTKDCVGDLLASRSIEALDLGWNCFSAEVFQHLGEKVVGNQRLQSLSIANCSEAHRQAGDAPILYFLEYLSNDTSLTNLDLSLNRISFCGGLVLEDALQNHRKLTNLHISHNPLGVLGLRSLLRLLLRKSSGLLEFHCDDCTNGPKSDAAEVETQVFNPNHPGGRYTLDLQRPYNRAILRMLYKTAELFKCSLDSAFQDIVCDPGPYSHPQRDWWGCWLVPESGKLAVTFSIEKCMETGLKKANEGTDFKDVLKEHYALTRLPPLFRKIIPLYAHWRRLTGHALEQTVILDAMSKDFAMTYPQVAQFCVESRSVTNDVISCLLPSMSGGTLSRYLLMLQASSFGEFIRNYKAVAGFLTFNPDNPTGRYRLDLSNPAEHTVAEQLLLLDRWESGLAKKKGRFPVSRHGNHTQIRNESYMKRELGVQTIDQWKLPEVELFELDYVSGRRPQQGVEALDEETFDNIMSTLHSSDSTAVEITKVLRVISSYVFCTAIQLRELLGIFRHDDDRADVFVLFYMRVVDMENEKVFRVRFADKPEELKKLRKRLGVTTMMPFIQPEQTSFELDMAIHDERLCASIILDLASRESPLQNLRRPSYIREDGTRDPLTTGVPRSWATFEKCPTGGIFRVQYECAPEDRCFAHRVRLMETFGFWTSKKDDEDVMWWAALGEAPQDVLELLEFLVGRFDHISEVFPIFDGENGNGLISLREFEDGVRTLQCHKFRGRGERERIANIFRYLDPSGEGQVSKGEWSILDKLWREMRESIREFVQFLERTFSAVAWEQGIDVLDAAWNFIDEDGSGEIDRQEWSSLVHDGLKYFGPDRIIFHFLDKDGEGTVSNKEFRALEVFQRDYAAR